MCSARVPLQMQEETHCTTFSLKNYRQLGEFVGERISTSSQKGRLPAGRPDITEKQCIRTQVYIVGLVGPLTRAKKFG